MSSGRSGTGFVLDCERLSSRNAVTAHFTGRFRLFGDLPPVAVVVLQRLVRLAPEVGLEPTTHRLTADCSTIELLWNPNGRPIYKSLSTPSTDDLSRSAHLESTTIWRLESRQNPHAGKGALRSAAFPGCGLAELPTPKLAPACGGPWW